MMNKSVKGKACYLLIGFFCILQYACGQDQKLADSLARIYQNAELVDTVKMELLKQLSFNELFQNIIQLPLKKQIRLIEKVKNKV